jgi:hypothetical protein
MKNMLFGKNLKILSQPSIISRLILSLCLLVNLPVYAQSMAQTGTVQNPKLTELSGISRSCYQPNLFWVHNDSGDKAEVYAIDAQGKSLGRIKLKGVKNTDWEDITSFEHKGRPYLLIADTGDNKAKRKSVQLHLFKEPKRAKLNSSKKLKLRPKATLNISFSKGPRDIEAIAIDKVQQTVILLTKRTRPAEVYSLPIKQLFKAAHQDKPKTIVLNPDFTVTHFNNQKQNRVTAMDIALDAKSAIVTTKNHLYYFNSPFANNLEQLLNSTPIKMELAKLKQVEAVTFNQNASQAWLVSEGEKSPIIKFELNTQTTK